VKLTPMAETTSPTAPAPVLLFDGECGLCRRVVGLLLRLDRRGRLRFAPLQGPAAQAFLAAHGLPTQDFSSLLFVPDWARRERPDFRPRTDGVIAALRTCGGVGHVLAGLLAAFPAGVRDAGYRWISRWRHRIFGPGPPGPIRPEWRDRFLG
jgi:predicted DCC family thiol-disulfide oxidoreductase YuxK